MQVSKLHSKPAAEADLTALGAAAHGGDEKKLAEASRNFEAILVRQFLGDSLKTMVKGPSSQVYEQFLQESLASKITEGRGLGLSSIIQAQLSGGTHAPATGQAEVKTDAASGPAASPAEAAKTPMRR